MNDLIRVRAKICGLTNREDAECAIAAGADALGFNLYEHSKRFIRLEEHASWMVELPPFVLRVAVVVNLPFTDAQRLAEHPAIDLVQFHGDEDEGYCANFAKLGVPFIKALRLGSSADVDRAAGFSTQNILVDAHVGGAYGGTGTRLDWNLAADLVTRFPRLRVILAGGLNPGNVGAAVARVKPYAVDVASGVEAEPRRKSAELVRTFLRALEAKTL